MSKSESHRFQPFPPELTDERIQYLIRLKASGNQVLATNLLTQTGIIVPFLRDEKRLGNTPYEMSKLRLQAREAGKQTGIKVENETTVNHPLYGLDQFFAMFAEDNSPAAHLFLTTRANLREEVLEWKKVVTEEMKRKRFQNKELLQMLSEAFYMGGIGPFNLSLTDAQLDKELTGRIIRELGVTLAQDEFDGLIQRVSPFTRHTILLGADDSNEFFPSPGVETKYDGIRLVVGFSSYHSRFDILFECNSTLSRDIYNAPPLAPVDQNGL